MENRERKGVIVLAIAGIFVLFFGIWSISYKIKSPFFLKEVNIASLSDSQNNDISKDTDSDGLTDFDETNFYHTSPYLEDTDSDDISDFKEIANGTDPNCPEGKECTSTSIDTSGSGLTLPTTSSSDLSTDTITTENPLINPDGTIRKDLSVQDIREILKVMGISDDELSQLSDSDITKLYKDTLSTTQL